MILAIGLGCCCPCGGTNFTPSEFDDLTIDEIEPAVDDNAVDAQTTNKYFPSEVEGYEIVFTDEKQGTTMADVKVDGVQVATLAIFDTVSNEEAREKFANAESELQGYPLVTLGPKSMVLVGDRYQVTVQSKGGDFDDEFVREEWLSEFDLDGLSTLK